VNLSVLVVLYSVVVLSRVLELDLILFFYSCTESMHHAVSVGSEAGRRYNAVL